MIDGKQQVVYGTSASTAYVSGVAAQIKSRYDWMTNTNLKDTLFTTATAMADTDAYGVGIINPNKALNGYGRFDADTVLNVNGSRPVYFFDNNITGNGGMIKDGDKTLVLNGDNTYTGFNQVNQGKLVLNGHNVAGTTVNPNGTLVVGDKETQISSGTIINHGNLDSLTTADLQVNGNLTSDGTINKAIGSSINVSGTANVDKGTLNVVGVAQGYTTKDGKIENLLTANQIDGQFANINATKVSDLINNKVDVGQKSVTVTTYRETVGNTVQPMANFAGRDTLVHNADAVLDHYDSIVAANDSKLDTPQSEAIAAALLSSLNISQTLFAMGTETAKHAQENLSISAANQNSGFMKNVQYNLNGVWMNYRHQQGKLDLQGLGGKSNENGVEVGVAKTINQHSFGVGINTNNANWNETYQGQIKAIDADSVGVNLGYVYHVNMHDFNLYTLFGYNHLNYKDDNGHGNQYSLGFGINKTWKLGENWYLTPDISVQYLDTKTNEIKAFENVFVRDLKTRQWIADFGLDALYQVNTKFGITGSLNISQDLSRKTTYQADYAGYKVENASNEMGKTRYAAGLGLNFIPAEHVTVRVGVKHERGNHWKENSANVNVSYQF